MYVAGPGGVYIFSTDEDGNTPHWEFQGQIYIDDLVSNTYYGSDGNLYVTANTNLFKFDMNPPEDPCENVMCEDTDEIMPPHCEGDMAVHYDGHQSCYPYEDADLGYMCRADEQSEYCEHGCYDGMCMEESKESESKESSESEEFHCEWEQMGRGLCRGDHGEAPPNFSADGYDRAHCKMSCEHTPGCIGISLSQGGRCAMWLRERADYEHEKFGHDHPGEGWRRDSRITMTDDDERWDCAAYHCERVVETCEMQMVGLVWAYGEMEDTIEQCQQDNEMMHRMFEQCLTMDKEPTSCHSVPYWHDNQGRDCAFYEAAEMCDYDYLHIFADDEGHDANTACCECGGGEREYTRRQLSWDEP
eukprot:UN01909